eukprot:2246682-Rhodomonas_salina.2
MLVKADAPGASSIALCPEQRTHRHKLDVGTDHELDVGTEHGPVEHLAVTVHSVLGVWTTPGRAA